MLAKMTFAVDGGAECLGTKRTLEGMAVAMDGHVTRQGAVRREERITQVTLVVLGPYVGPCMGLQHPRRHKHPPTLEAFKWLFT